MGTLYLVGQDSTEKLSLTQAGSLGLGIGTGTALATLDVRGNSGTLPVASFSGSTTNVGLIVDNNGTGDLLAASKSGATKFVIKNSGNVGIGTTLPSEKFDVVGNIVSKDAVTATQAIRLRTNGGSTDLEAA